MTWEENTACTGMDPEIFFPATKDWMGERNAKRICNGCSVQEQCLEYAIVEGIDLGIWGGKNEHERKRLTNRRLVAARPY